MPLRCTVALNLDAKVVAALPRLAWRLWMYLPEMTRASRLRCTVPLRCTVALNLDAQEVAALPQVAWLLRMHLPEMA